MVNFLFLIQVDDTNDYYINSVKFLDKKNGVSYGPYSSLSSDFNLINLKTINFPHDGRALPLDDASATFVAFLFHFQSAHRYIIIHTCR